MKTPKEKATERIVKKWEQAEKEKKKAVQEYSREKAHIAKTIKTDGWKILVKLLEAKHENLAKKLFKTSSWRVFRNIELRSEMRALDKLLVAMQGEEKKFYSSLLIDKE